MLAQSKKAIIVIEDRLAREMKNSFLRLKFNKKRNKVMGVWSK